MFERHLARRHREFLRSHRDRMIAAVYANSTYDGEEASDARTQMLDAVNNGYDDVVEILYGDRVLPSATEQREEAMMNDPLFRGVFQQIRAEQGGITYDGAGDGALLLR